MAILQFDKISKAFSGDYILEDINFSVEEKDKIGLVGVNGSGKSTIMKIILEMEHTDVDRQTNSFGNVIKKKGLKIGYLSQHPELNEMNTIYEEMEAVFFELDELYQKIDDLNHEIANLKGEAQQKKMEEAAELSHEYEEKGGYNREYRIKYVLGGIGFAEKEYKTVIRNLSGGQKSRVAIAKLLLSEPDILMLDEPTNHLDINAVEWLETFLKTYKKAVLLISHDRYFLDSVVTKIFEIEAKKVYRYNGNYTQYVLQKELRKKGEIREYEKQQEKIKETEAYILKYKAGIKARQASGRQKILDRMERMDDPDVKNGKMKVRFETDRVSGDSVLKIKNLSKKYNGRKIFENVSCEIFRGQRIGILGKNGIGKSTLLKIINRLEMSDTGELIFGKNVDIGYYDQQHMNLNFGKTILDELRETFPISEEEARSAAGMFLFTKDDIFKEIGVLSGGERARVSFIKLMMTKPNFLIFDEPTNHLDIYSREVLEDSLQDFDGTMIVVSHDRYFLERTTDLCFELTENGIEKFEGDYEFYKSKKMLVTEEKKDKNNSYENQKKLKNQLTSLTKKYSTLEKKIEDKENEKAQLEKEYAEAGVKNEYKLLMELQEKLDNADLEILELMEEWEETGKSLAIVQEEVNGL